jgi:pimeloyl-ACP methyl ester carboxylesterase
MNPLHQISTKHFPQLSYKRYGNGPALMLIHGFPASGNLWADVQFQLSQGLTLLIPDLPGTGSSQLNSTETSMEQLASVVPDILDDAGIGQCVVAGHSMGGYIALAAAALFPDRLKGLSLVHSTALPDDDDKKDKRRKAIALIQKGGAEQFIKGMIPPLFSEHFRNAHPEVIQDRIEEALKLPPESLVAFYNAMIARPSRLELLPGASFPMQWILGEEDSTIPWRSCLPQTSLPERSFVSLYESCAHMSMLEQAEELQKDLVKFVLYCQQQV